MKFECIQKMLRIVSIIFMAIGVIFFTVVMPMGSNNEQLQPTITKSVIGFGIVATIFYICILIALMMVKQKNK